MALYDVEVSFANRIYVYVSERQRDLDLVAAARTRALKIAQEHPEHMLDRNGAWSAIVKTPKITRVKVLDGHARVFYDNEGAFTPMSHWVQLNPELDDRAPRPVPPSPIAAKDIVDAITQYIADAIDMGDLAFFTSASQWWVTSNIALMGRSPIEVLAAGEAEDLLAYVETAIAFHE